MKLIDAHTHMQDDQFRQDQAEVLARAQKVGVKRFICNGTWDGDWEAVLELSRCHPEVTPCFGVHPWFVGRCRSGWQDRLAGHLKQTGSAMGEIGLDRWLAQRDEPLQELFFEAQMDMATRLNRPVMIHCLKAWGWLKALLERRSADRMPPALLIHACGASVEMMNYLAGRGCYFSYAGNVLDERKETMREALRATPRDRLLLESDAPDMLPPAGYRPWSQVDADGKGRNEPANLAAIYEGVAGLLGIETEELAEMTWENGRRLLGA